MCCVIEIAMLVFGIVTLVQGKFTVSKSRVVTGPPAYLIGAVLTLTLPMIVLIGVTIGIVLAIQDPAAAQRGEIRNPALFSLVDIIGVLGGCGVVLLIGMLYGRDPQAALPASTFSPYGLPPNATPPADPNNPYNPPFTR